MTETLFALMRDSPDALPDEIHVITTAEGAERVRLALLSDQPGWLRRFAQDFDLSPVRLGLENIHVVRDAAGEPLSDIRTAQDNILAADQIADLVRRLTSDDVTELHVSMAGGRKTLGFFAGYALSLWGRPQDRLTHVLVNDPFEQSWDFFYPTPYERIIETRSGSLADCSQADVTLADIPFVRMRSSLPRTLLDGKTCFADAVHAAQTLLAPPRLVIDLDNQLVEAAGSRFQLRPAELAFLAWFARRAKQGLPAISSPKDGAPLSEHARAYLDEYRRIRGVIGDDGRSAARYDEGMTKGDFAERKSKLKREMELALGSAAHPYLVRDNGRRPMGYHLALEPSAIEFGVLGQPAAPPQVLPSTVRAAG